jgi:hypothetical protein
MGWKPVLLCLALAGVALGWATKHDRLNVHQATDAPPAAAKTAASDKAFAPWVVEQAVKRHLRDPDSAVLRDLTSTNDRKIGDSPAGLIVCGYVNAKNGFGGYAGEKMFIDFYKLGIVDIEPTPRTKSFVASWNKLCAR